MTDPKVIKRAEEALKLAHKVLEGSSEGSQDLAEVNTHDDLGNQVVNDLGELDGMVEEVDPEAELIGVWSEASDLGRVREAITFDRHGGGYSLVKIKYQNSKVLSIHKLQPDTEGNARNLATQELQRIILKLKKQPSDNNPT